MDTVPTLSGFIVFIRTVMGITTTVLPDDSPVIEPAYTVALNIVNLQLNVVPTIYVLAVYNLGGSNIINFAQDQTGQDYFENARKLWSIGAFSAGVVQSATDVSTSVSMVIQKAMENITLADLQYLKDPYGRRYLALAQKAGTLWGLS